MLLFVSNFSAIHLTCFWILSWRSRFSRKKKLRNRPQTEIMQLREIADREVAWIAVIHEYQREINGAKKEGVVRNKLSKITKMH